MNKQDKQSVVAPSAVVAAGLASATAAVVTSKFGVAGTIGGAALTSMIINGGSAIYKAYIERASSRIREIPSTVQIRTGRDADPEAADSPPGRPDLQNNVPGRFRAALGWFSALPLPRRRSILIGALIAGVLSLLLSLGAVTGVELGAGKSLSCWVWNDCPTASSGSKASSVSTRPSIFGGGQSVDSGTPQEAQPSNSQQQPVPGVPASPPQTPGSGEQQPAPPAPDQQRSPSGGLKEPQQSPSGGSKDQQPEDQRQSPSGNPPGNSVEQQPEAQQQSPPPGESKSQQPGNQGSVSPTQTERTTMAADEPQ